MISIDEAIEMAVSETSRLEVEEVPILSAAGSVLAEDIHSDLDMPPFDKSSMDGYAVKAEDCNADPAILAVVGTIPAGVYPHFRIQTGQAAKIMTGAPLPAGADSVQMVEKTEGVSNGKVKILEAVSRGQNVASKSEIIQSGQRVLTKGTCVTPPVIGVLAVVGRNKVEIYRRPRVGILVTGDELVEIDQRPRAGQIRNSNGYALYHQVLATGAVPELLGIVPDDTSSLRKVIGAALSKDVLLISGGVSMGEFDLVEDVLAECKVETYYDKVNIKPGKPTVFGKSEHALVFGLPGNPVSASTIFEIVVKPTLRKMMGFSRLHNLQVTAILEKDFRSKTRRQNYQPAYTVLKNGTFFTSPLHSRGSADVMAFSRSNSYVIAPAEVDEYKQGQTILTMLRDDFWQEGSNHFTPFYTAR
ncbi:MAG: gephyrin-like molybdotransferase Glp [bacterium]